MKETTVDRLEEIRARVEKATPGEWRTFGTGGIYGVPDIGDEIGDCVAILDSRGGMAGPEEMRADADFIAHARSDIPYLLTELQAAEQREAALRKALEEISEGKGRYSLDRFEHACNTVEDMKALAVAALSPTKETV